MRAALSGLIGAALQRPVPRVAGAGFPIQRSPNAFTTRRVRGADRDLRSETRGDDLAAGAQSGQLP